MKDHKKILYDKLLPLHHSDELNTRLEILMPTSTGAQQLMIKMEIRRLMAPCHQPIDLRGKVAGECRSYVLQGVAHWLDDVAINLYHQRLEIYQNNMTLGLWEELHQTPNSYRLLHKKTDLTPSIKTHKEVKPVYFGDGFSRCENRIQLSTPLQAFLPNGMEVHGSTLDISKVGLRVKMPASFQYEKDDILTLYFPQLEEECSLPALISGLEYRVLFQEEESSPDHFERLRLHLVTPTDVMKEVIILKNKNNKTRLENEDKVLTLRTQSYEQLFLAQTPSLSLFFQEHELKFSLLTDNNQSLWDYWHDERNLPVIHRLLTPERLAQFQQEKSGHSETLIYCFTHTHADKTYFFSAIAQELTEELRHLFWHFGSKRASWRVLRLSMTKITEDNLEQLEITPDFIEKIKSLTHIALLQDLTFTHTNSDFRARIKPKNSGHELNPFKHPRAQFSAAQAISSLRLPQRKEDRYVHKIVITLAHPTKGEFTAKSIDFSPHGLHLWTTAPYTGNKSQEIGVTFNDLMRADPKAPLQDVPYHVVRIGENGRDLKLSLIKNRQSEDISHYFQRLIDHNQKKLKLDNEFIPEALLLNTMQQLLLTRLVSIPYFLYKENDTLHLSAMAVNDTNSLLAQLLKKDANAPKMSLQHIFGDQISKYAIPVTRQQGRQSQIKHELYFALEWKDGAIYSIKRKTLENFKTREDRMNFIVNAHKNGAFIALRNWMQPINNGENYLNNEDYWEVRKQSSSKAKKIGSEFSKLCVYGELSDITDEVLLRFDIEK